MRPAPKNTDGIRALLWNTYRLTEEMALYAILTGDGDND